MLENTEDKIKKFTQCLRSDKVFWPVLSCQIARYHSNFTETCTFYFVLRICVISFLHIGHLAENFQCFLAQT